MLTLFFDQIVLYYPPVTMAHFENPSGMMSSYLGNEYGREKKNVASFRNPSIDEAWQQFNEALSLYNRTREGVDRNRS